MAEINVTLIGLNRTSVSLALLLKAYSKSSDANHRFVITSSDESAGESEVALQLGAVDIDVRELTSAVNKANLVVVAAPYQAVQAVFRSIGPVLMPGAVVVDLSPLKVPSIQWADEYFRRASDGRFEAYLVGAALIPSLEFMADPRTDSASAQADLFQSGKLILSPAVSCPPEAIQFVSDLAALLNLKIHFTDPAEQDGITAAMEALPLLMQLALFRTVNGNPAWDDYQQLANVSFALGTYRLTTDHYQSSTLLATENQANSVRALENLIAKLYDIRDLLSNDDPARLQQAFADSTERYETWLSVRDTGNTLTSGSSPHMIERAGPNLFGALSGLSPFGRKKTSRDSQT